MRGKSGSGHTKKKTLRKWYFAGAVVTILVIAAVVYVLITMPPSSKRRVEVQLIDPPGLIYNSTIDELRFWLNFTPSDSNISLSRMVHPTFPQETLFHERLDENGTVIEFALSNYSLYWGTPLSGSVVALDLYFSDVNTNQEIAKTEVRIKMP